MTQASQPTTLDWRRRGRRGFGAADFRSIQRRAICDEAYLMCTHRRPRFVPHKISPGPLQALEVASSHRRPRCKHLLIGDHVVFPIKSHQGLLLGPVPLFEQYLPPLGRVVTFSRLGWLEPLWWPYCHHSIVLSNLIKLVLGVEG
jgi:hypothetical protein